ncbi:MAG TPA: hypothetical protein VIJ35_12665 [Bradyrhizobium sp.]
MTLPEHITWQIREVLQTLLRGYLVVPKTVDLDAKSVRELLVAMWLDGLVSWTEESGDSVFRITCDGCAALSEAARHSDLSRLPKRSSTSH